MGFVAGPIIRKIGRKAFVILALACMGLGLIAVAFAIPHGEVLCLAVAPCLYYFGTSFFCQPIVDTATLTVTAEESGRALGFNDLIQAITGSVGVALFGQMMANGAVGLLPRGPRRLVPLARGVAAARPHLSALRRTIQET